MPPRKDTALSAAKTSAAAAAGLAFAWLACLIMMYRQHAWILDKTGRPLVTDFLEVWVAGRTALSGTAAAAYDPRLHHAAQAVAVGHDFHGYLWWHYPPVVLFLAAALALLPYLAAFLVWVASTLAFYSASISQIAGTRFAGLLACAMPAVFVNAMIGQNGFLTATLIGLALVNLEMRPVLAGVFVGLLTYKPQFGILFPLVLVASGDWKAFCSATAVAVAAVVVPSLVFGGETIRAFLHFLPQANDSLLVHGAAGWNKLQTVYGLLRWLGYDHFVASADQAMLCVTVAAALAWLWRTKVPFELKAAALATAVLFATPYTYMYDLPILAVPLAFLYRQRHFETVELAAIAFATVCMLGFVFNLLVIPIGCVSAAIVGMIVIRRIWKLQPITIPQLVGVQVPEVV
ncbi:MAG TPA: glycosyltransferase family 87 protein [Rhizomicrobium sp.]|jgi:hypothetical protein|nr:glycosyltransferase family 87 protein [Rhizomicrobium sp.]